MNGARRQTRFSGYTWDCDFCGQNIDLKK
jgi:hypothetical protein